METLFTLGSFIANISPVTILLVSVFVLVVLIGALIVVQIRNNAHIHDLTFPVYDYTVKEAQKRADEIVREAQEKARSMIAATEVEAAKALGDRGHESERLMSEYEKRLAELMHKHESDLQAYAAEAQKAFGGLNETFKQHVAATESAVQHELQTFADETKTTRSRLEEETKKLIAEHLEREVASVREGLRSYRKERMKLIERDIVSIIEQAIAIVVRRELPLKDHADLVYQALEEAKREGTLV